MFVKLKSQTKQLAIHLQNRMLMVLFGYVGYN